MLNAQRTGHRFGCALSITYWALLFVDEAENRDHCW
jgi:hypothetical protein